MLWPGVALTCAVIFVNGWTDAPNSIAVAVSCHALPPRRALALAAVMEALGVVLSALVAPGVVRAVLLLNDFTARPDQAAAALSAALLAVLLWALLAWRLGLPTSESHALLAALSGAALALGGRQSVNAQGWLLILGGLLATVALSMLLGRLCARLLSKAPVHSRRWPLLQIAAAAALAFLHGAQDGQKFAGVLLLALALSQGVQPVAYILPLWALLLTGALLAVGVRCGGTRILRTLSQELTVLSPPAGCAADAATILCLLAGTVLGVPLSTTQARAAAMAGAGRDVNKKTAARLLSVWLFTFPLCALLGYAGAILFT